jgi:phosphoribosyl 1,2-cyclic phosphate phosphodiesterase
MEPHPSHMSIDEACAAATDICGKSTYLTHLTHRLEHEVLSKKLNPKGVQLAYDGLRLKL